MDTDSDIARAHAIAQRDNKRADLAKADSISCVRSAGRRGAVMCSCPSPGTFCAMEVLAQHNHDSNV